MEIKFKSDTIVSHKGAGELQITSPTIQVNLKGIEDELAHALVQLSSFVDVDQLAHELNTAHFHYYIELFKKKDLLTYRTHFFQLSPHKAINVSNAEILGTFNLCRFALFRVCNSEMIIETPMAPAAILIRGEGAKFFYALRKPTNVSDLLEQFQKIDAQHVKESLALLAAVQLLTFDKEDPLLNMWEPHDLYFQSRSRMGRHHYPYGGTFHMKDKAPPEPCFKLCPSQKLIALEQPTETPSLTYFETLNKRRSIRDHGKKPLTSTQLSAFLFHTAREKKERHRDDELCRRPYPGGGARYELEIYLVMHNCQGLKRGIYHYHPLEHALCHISDLEEKGEQLLEDACRSSGKTDFPQVLLLISARFKRIFWKYQSMGYAAILKDVGVLMQTMYLTATALGLAPCALGGGNSDHFNDAMGTRYLEETSVGEFMLGSL